MKLGIIATGIWDSIYLDVLDKMVADGHKIIVYTEDAKAPSGKNFTLIQENNINFFVINDKRRNPWLWLPDRILKPIFGRRFFTTLYAIFHFIRINKDVDVFIVESDWLAFWLIICRQFIKFKWIVGIHDTDYLKINLNFPTRPKSYLREKIKHKVIQSANGIRANSKVTYDALIEGGSPLAKTTNIPLNIAKWMLHDTQLINLHSYRVNAKKTITDKLGVPSDAKILISMSRVAPVKGLELAIETLANIFNQNKNCYLCICGPDRVFKQYGSTIDNLKKAATKLGIEKHVFFPGEIDKENVKIWIAGSDVNIVPSWIDTFNYAVVEATILGTPSIMSDKVGAAPIIVESKMGSIIKQRDAVIWGQELLKVLNKDYTQRQEASKWIINKLSANNIAQEQIMWYKKVISTT